MTRLHVLGSRTADEKQVREGFTRTKNFVKIFLSFFDHYHSGLESESKFQIKFSMIFMNHYFHVNES